VPALTKYAIDAL
jgi:hypothetical protein